MSKVFTTDPQQLIGQYIPVWYNPCNGLEEPSYHMVADARMDEDGHTILVKFHNEETGAIDYDELMDGREDDDILGGALR